MKTFLSGVRLGQAAMGAIAALLLYGCSTMSDNIDSLMTKEDTIRPANESSEINAYYDKIFQKLSHRSLISKGKSPIKALDALPQDGMGKVNWTAAVVDGHIDPAPSLDPNVVDDPPFNLNVFIEAKVPLMANVIFPHSIHTYWLSCNVCHPKIFLPEAGANPISMEEIFKGEWCGRCHGKVAFDVKQPRQNCTRCHSVLKGDSMEKEHFR